jgi:uncharacterized protein (DUF58 family)
VRVYTEERDRPVLLVVDQRQSMFFGSKRAMKWWSPRRSLRWRRGGC